uniref:Uncharacterized protein LOC111099190 isoform X1 n=1 Tax=Crassostrea virginica TaxID=6565 RepID=A0A8B8A4B6_CRAVI|nr:uncharacterized protein LOC111099190 isoform X1 [Crassostrea virginica]
MEVFNAFKMRNILMLLSSILVCIVVPQTFGMPHIINLSVRPIRTDCSVPEVGSKPFFYGTNDLACMYLTTIGLYRHRRKRSLQLPVHNFVHSFIYYDGWFAEFGTKDTTLRRHSPKYAHCGPKIMHPPAGFTKLPFECLRKCASKYHLVFGNYNLLKNNCHVFSNKMMEVLCHEVTCPFWCL